MAALKNIEAFRKQITYILIAYIVYNVVVTGILFFPIITGIKPDTSFSLFKITCAAYELSGLYYIIAFSLSLSSQERLRKLYNIENGSGVVGQKRLWGLRTLNYTLFLLSVLSILSFYVNYIHVVALISATMLLAIIKVMYRISIRTH